MSKETICPKTGAIIYAHIFTQDSNPSKRTAVINTNVNPVPNLENHTYVYSSFAPPKKAQQWIKSQSGEQEQDLIIKE